MPHVNELYPAARAVAGVALALLLLAACTDTQRRAPLLADPGAQNIARGTARDAVAARQPADAFDAAVRADSLPPATTGVSIGASRRA